MKDASCSLSLPVWADLQGEGIEKSGLHVLPSHSRDWYAGLHTTLRMPASALLCAVHCPYLICRHHLAVNYDAPVLVLCQHCFCCPNSKGLTITAWRLLCSTTAFKGDSFGSVPQTRGTVAQGACVVGPAEWPRLVIPWALGDLFPEWESVVGIHH